MNPGASKPLAGFGLLAAIAVLVVTDALLTDLFIPSSLMAEQPEVTEPQTPEPPTSPTTTLPNGGVAKASGPNVLEVLTAHDVTFIETQQMSIIEKIFPSEVVQTRILLLDGDRAGFVSWMQSPRVKKNFIVLKEALSLSFSPNVADLIDETQRIEGKPTRNFLSFHDPVLTEERLVFLRVRERLYELHIAEGQDDLIFEVVEDLSE